MKKPLLQRLNWVNTLFLTLVPIAGVLGTIYLAMHHQIHTSTIILSIFMIIAGGISITAGYHRLFAHSTYQAAWPIRVLFMLFGASAFEGSVLEWSTDHRNHHRYTDDLEKDPYSIDRGFWFAHIGWLFLLDPEKRNYNNVEDLAKDKLIAFQHKFFVPIAVLTGFIFPALLACLWHDFWGGLIIAGFLRTCISQHCTFCINSFCHMIGKRPYSDRISARDSWITALVTFGEGYHNFHHQFPLDYRNAIRFHQFDPTKWLIFGLSKLGLASNLKRVNQKHIIEYKLRMDEARLIEAAQKHHFIETDKLAAQISELLLPVRESIHHALLRVEEMEKLYQKYKLQYQRRDLRKARRELRQSLMHWSRTVQVAPMQLALEQA